MTTERSYGLRLTMRRRHIGVLAVLLFVVSGASVIFLVWRVTQIGTTMVEQTALEHARLKTNALAEFRTLYTENVVAPALEAGLLVTHDYEDHARAIPLPATFSMELGERLSPDHEGVSSRLYSPFPFPWRGEAERDLGDFEAEAWRRLNESPDAPFYRFETVAGRRSLRYATADIMRSSCVECHNSHPDSPRRNWRTGDVRGVLEVVLPIEFEAAQAAASTRATLLASTVLALCGLTGLFIVVRYFRRTSARIERQAIELSNEVAERARVEEEIRSMADTQRSLLLELDHRVKNNLAGLLTLVDFGRRSDQDVETVTRALSARVMAMKLAHEVISQASHRRADLGQLLRDLADAILTAEDGVDQIEIIGEPVGVEPSQASAFAMIFQELLTNSEKYGALSSSDGRVLVAWRRRGASGLALSWRETGGPPPVAPTRRGMGLSLIEGFCRSELRGSCEMSFDPPGFRLELASELDERIADDEPAAAYTE